MTTPDTTQLSELAKVKEEYERTIKGLRDELATARTTLSDMTKHVKQELAAIRDRVNSVVQDARIGAQHSHILQETHAIIDKLVKKVSTL